MEKREIKFRFRFVDTSGTKFLMEVFTFDQILNGEPYHYLDDQPLLKTYRYDGEDEYTGFKMKGQELYEGDIIRIEENSEDGKEDEIFYVVIQWIKEWGMFATLLLDEYKNYPDQGLKALDEPSFWTYTLEDTDDLKHFLAGNIYQNPDLLTP